MQNKNGTRTSHALAAAGIALLAGIALSSRAAEPAAKPADGTPVAVEVFKGPKPVKTPGPPYPESERQTGGEGWVHVNFMIDPQGKPFEITVVESTGSKAFEKAALNAVEKWTFEPATDGGTPTTAGQDYKLLFILDAPATGARPEFVRAYKQLMQAIAAGDRAAADTELAKLTVKNLYEDAYINLGRFNYHTKWGTQAEQIQDLRRAIAGERSARYLEKKTFIAALSSLLGLQIKAQDLARAMQTWETLQKVAPKKETAFWQSTMDKIEALRRSDTAFAMTARMSEVTSSWHGELFKKRFQIIVASGKVSDIKLRCEKQYLFFRYEPGLQYKVDAPSGKCSIEVVGDPGTSFDLIQS
jgi:TonB family protein